MTSVQDDARYGHPVDEDGQRETHGMPVPIRVNSRSFAVAVVYVRIWVGR